MNNEERYNGKTKEEILSSPRLKCNKKGKYKCLLLFPNELLLNTNFKTITVVGLKVDDTFEVIGDCLSIEPFNCSITVDSTSVNVIRIGFNFSAYFVVYGFSKDHVIETLKVFKE